MKNSTRSRTPLPWMAAACALLLVVGLLPAEPADAQVVGRSGLHITAVDEEGERIAGLDLVVSPEEGTRGAPHNVTTNRRGQVALRFLESGWYAIDVADPDRYFPQAASGEIRDSGGVRLDVFDMHGHPQRGLIGLPVHGGHQTMVEVVVTDAEERHRLRRQLAGLEAREQIEELVEVYGAGDYQAVVDLSAELLAETPDLPDVLHLKGLAEAQLGRHDEAERLLREAVEIEPEFGDYLASLGTFLLEKGQRLEVTSPQQAEAAFAEAEEVLGGAIDVMEEVPVQLLINHALALDHSGRSEEAIAVFYEIIERDPENLGVYFRLAATYREMGQGDKALEVIDSLPDATGQRAADALYNVAVSFYNEQNYSDAKSVLERALDAQPDHGLAHRLMGRTYIAAGQEAEAIPHLRRFLELEPDHPDAADEREVLRFLEEQEAG